MKKNKRKLLPEYSKIFFALLALFLSLSAFAQKVTSTGQVMDSQNQPVIGGSVLEKGTTNGVITDLDGNFSLSVANGATLVISYVGCKSQEVKASTHMKIVLKEDNELLDEVVVIGYGSVSKKDVTTSISTISTKDLDQRPIVSADQALQGKAAGVAVIKPNGLPGEGMVVRVRGASSMNSSNDPLYVVDGVPTDNISFLSANDIESMQVLKDASSQAIYGSRGANGVVIITTKSGASGTSKITLNAYTGITALSKKIKSLNVADYRELLEDMGSTISLPDDLTDQTDWYDETYRTAFTQNYQASVSDGTDKLRYFISGGYTGEDGIIKVAFYKRYNFRANIDNQLRKWLKIGANVSYSDYTSNGIISGQGSNRGGVVLSVINTPTYAPVWDPDNAGQYYTGFYGVNITSPAENMARSKNNKSKNNRLIATGNAEITFSPELKFKSTVTLDKYNYHYTSFLDPTTTTYGRDQNGTASDNRSTTTVLIYDNILTYNKQLGKHGLNIMGGTSGTTSDYSYTYQTVTDFADGSIETLNAGNNVSQSNGTTASQWSLMSYLGRVSYNYDSKYLLTANMRIDGSSKLDPDHRWGYFPSLSAAWRISSEPFMKELTWIDDMKIRGGWGQSGNQSGLGEYDYLQRYSITRQNWWEEGMSNATPIITQSTLRNTDLTWETTTQTNVGLDLTILRNRLTFTLDYYFKKTTDMLVDVTLPSGAAVASSITRNEGEMTNKGFEFSVNSRNLVGKFTWDTDFNISFNRNKLTNLELTKVYYAAQTSDNLAEYCVRNEPGRPLGSFYGYISDGVDSETGELIYRDVTDDGQVTSSDRTYIGDPNPDFTFGLTNTFSYKGFNLSILLQGSYGNDIFNASKMETEGMYDGKNQSTRVLSRWRRPGMITSIPKAGFEMKTSSYFVEDGSYLRVKDVTLSYSFSGGLLRKWGITRLQPYFSTTNLLTFTKYTGMDPEVNQWGNSGTVQGIDWGTYPQTKSFVVGVNIDF
ncbi:MAG: TonB dependent receptor [Bacteroidetes bacterium]|nr:TonB dependent receptor [Bacteroidota bacterium]